MDDVGFVLLVLAATLPFLLAIRISQPGPLKEPPFRIDASGVTVFPTCDHCGWRGELDVTSYVEDAAAMRASTIMRSPPCRRCGRRWDINLTTLSQRRRVGASAT